MRESDDGLTLWERVAASRWGSYVTEIEREGILEAAQLAGTPGLAVEVGCEGGRWSKMLADLGWKMTCIDVDSSTLKACQRKLPDAECILTQPSDQKIPKADKQCSLLLCIEVAPVVNSEWFLAEASRVLKPGGILVTVLWNSASFRGVANKLLSRQSNKGTRFYQRSYGEWRRSAEALGFKILKEEGFCWGPFGRASDSPLVSVFVGLEKALFLRNMPSISPWALVIARK